MTPQPEPARIRRRKPNGKYTYSATAYLRAWRALARPIEKAFGWRLRAFNPDLSFETPDGSIVDLKTRTASAMIERLAHAVSS